MERKVDGTAHRLFQRDLEERPTATLAQRRELMTRMAGVSVSDSTVSLTLRRMGFSRKKKIASIATMVLATTRLAGLTRKKEGFVPFH